MRDFFQHLTWPRPDGALHLYVLPDRSPILDAFSDAQARLAGIDGLPLMPLPWLHLTLQGLGRFDDAVTQAELSRFGAALGDAVAEIEPFELTFDTPVVRELAVECSAAPSAGWDALVTAARAAITTVWPGELPNPPHGPHLSLAYATGDVDDTLVTERLAGVSALGSLLVDRVELVSVTARPEMGIFDFTTLAGQELSGCS